MIFHLPDQLRQMIVSGALFVLNDSGGKDSQAMRLVVREVVPPNQRIVIHASLGDVEWPGALEHAQCGAERDEVPFVVARSGKTFFDMVERRFAARPSVPCWPSAANRQCTSDLKRDPIAREIRRVLVERGLKQIVNCVGIRRNESSSRSKLNPWQRSKRNCTAGRDWWDWLPIFELSREEVFSTIAAAGEQPHGAYGMGNERLSCMFCIMGSRNDLKNAANRNPELFERYIEIEERTGYTMHQSRVPLRQLAES